MKRIFKIQHIMLFFLGLIIFTACNKDDYYEDGGLAQAKYDGSILQYLETNPVMFDSVVQVIKLAGLEETFQNEEFTFFAPSDRNIRTLITNRLNPTLFADGLDTIKTLDEIEPSIWRKHLLKYMFKGKNLLQDYPQIDFNLKGTYPGQNYISYSGYVSNIGVVFNDVIQTDDAGNEISRLKYRGYRQIWLSYIHDYTAPDVYISCPISTSDIQPNNGVIHVINYTKSWFGLTPNSNDFVEDVKQSQR